jgi:hypothetical protein
MIALNAVGAMDTALRRRFDMFGRFGQYVSSYYVETFNKIEEGRGLLLDDRYADFVLTPESVAHIKAALKGDKS